MGERRHDQIVTRRGAVARQCPPLDGVVEAAAPRPQPLLTDWSRLDALIGDVVGNARERVHRRHVRPHRSGQKARGHGKVLVMRLREPLAIGIGARELGVYHSLSGVPARWLARRAITNRRSDRRFR